mmetsp:Transcript_33531/g.83551  ORF Transcript_33531/g.83551 Transcript_33531/m.83551 type:complete len:550 (+) Transcript_33531:105-1754(+)
MSAVEAELDELQRRYRIMEGDRKAYAEEVQNVLRKQRSHIDKLGKENSQLKTDLSLETRAMAMGGQVRISSQITKMGEAGEQYARRIELERQRTAALEKQLNLMHETSLKARRVMGGIYAPAESDFAVEKQVRVLENRLDKSLVKFNESIALNKELRESIDNLRRERIVFDSQYKKLQRDLAEKKRSMAEVIELANVAYEERDKLLAEAGRVRGISDAEAREFEAEWKSLGDTLDADLKRHETLARDVTKSVVNNAVGNNDVRGSLTMEDETNLKRQVRRQTWGLAKDKTTASSTLEKVANFEQAFAQIQAVTGISDIDELVSKFVQAEEQNFTRFNFLNELNGEGDKMEEALTQSRLEVERFRGTDRGADTQRRKHAKELEARVKAIGDRGVGYDEKWQAATTLIEQLVRTIEALCVHIGCNVGFLKEMSGNEGISESNMMVYLGVIEQRTNEVLRIYAGRRGNRPDDSVRVESSANDDNRTFLTSGAPLSARGASSTPADLTAAMAIAVPTTNGGDGDDDDEEDGRPLTRDELKARTVKGLAKKGAR